MSNSHEIRQQFIDYFAAKAEHTAVPSSPVVPHDDPTLLFTNAGMNQFKPYFLGTEQPPYPRAVDTQKCIRAGGKHNDLEDVGKDTYHHTFFEMLGNWSFGDYFKKEAIDWAWDLLVNVWKLDPNRLHATYFEGDASEGLEPDEEARKLWLNYLPAERIHTGNKKDNFWEMGDTGPCGPCSEIHYDRTPDKNGGKLVNADSPDVIEIWNLVFIQFNRGQDGSLAPLPAKHVDTGMGFERICAVIQNKSSNYDTDVFTPIFKAIADVTGAPPYTGELEKSEDIAYRVIADHIRCLTFALADGAHCGNEGRNYVLRSILRRAVRYGRQTLGCHEPFFYKLVPAVVEQMGEVFPELKKKQDAVAEELREEEESFSKTLDRGITLFDMAAKEASSRQQRDVDKRYPLHVPPFAGSNNKAVDITNYPDYSKERKEFLAQPAQISDENAFKLHDTYGFPISLTQLMAEERGMTVDVDGFNKLMEEARVRSRGEGGGADSRGSLVEIVQKTKLPATAFLGYDTTELTREVTLRAFRRGRNCGLYKLLDPPGTAIPTGREVAVVLDATPFYAESGGQVGDTGVIQIQNGARITVEDTIKVGDVFFHLGKLVAGELSDGTFTAALAVDAKRRALTVNNHTMTHVMNRALRDHVNAEADQKGSLVDPDKLRFDFSNAKAVTPEQIAQVEQQVNADIAADLKVDYDVVPQEQALKINGLRAVFGEKYPPNVRVVSIGAPVADLLADPSSEKWANLSIEFCGGTHLASTGIAEAFTIVSEEAVSKGIRRITALTGTAAKQAIHEGEQLLARVEALYDAPAEQLATQIEQVTQAFESAALPLRMKVELRSKVAELSQRIKELAKAQGKQQQEVVVEKARALAESEQGPVIVARLDGADANLMRTAMDVLRKRHAEAAILLAGDADGKVAIVAASPKDAIGKGLKAGDWVKQVAQVCGGGGGGKPDMAQAGGKDVTKIDEALEAARQFAAEKTS